MADADKALEQYIQKLMELEYTDQPDDLSDAKLKQIALDMGMTEREWQEARQQAMDELARGKAFLKSYNWKDAAKSLEAAVNMMPNNVEACAYAAKALINLGTANDDQNAFIKAEAYLDRALRFNPTHAQSHDLKRLLRDRQKSQISSRTRKGWIKWGVIGGVGLILILWLFSAYNSIITLEEDTVATWAQVENVYQRRADLVPQLVATVKAAAKHELDVIKEVHAARAALVQVDPYSLSESDLQNYVQKQDQLGGSLGRLMAVAESYPDLKATENFRDLQAQLEGTENRITVERRRFNLSVQAYNSKIRRFPYNMLGFSKKGYFQTDPKNQEPVKVNFD